MAKDDKEDTVRRLRKQLRRAKTRRSPKTGILGLLVSVLLLVVMKLLDLVHQLALLSV